MRLDTLEITGFGRLHGLSIHFGAGITIVLGDNESGKSTLHRAIRAALFGVDAGGQGRAVERSEWSRWQPWDGSRYGLALTYTLASGRRYRVARRLDQRDASVQVQELGGGVVTDDLRVGRAVVPGRVHLGVEEAVFCASACLGEDGLRADAADAPSRRTTAVQEALERLADSGNGTTAAEALARLSEASARIGSERRASSPLGAVTARLRQLEDQMESARRRHQTLAQEQDRLHDLEGAAAAADGRRLDTERAWLTGRLAALGAQRRELDEAAAESQRLDAVVAAEQRHARFPVEDEESLIALGGDLLRAEAIAQAAGERGDEARRQLQAISQRRAEIAAGLRVLAATPSISEAALAEVERLGAALAVETGVDRRRESLVAAESRGAALRREIAATGLGSIPIGQAATAQRLATAASSSGRQRRSLPIATTIIALALLVAAVCLSTGLTTLGLAAASGLLAVAAAVVLSARLGGGSGAAARRELRQLYPAMDSSEPGIQRLLDRADDLISLHAEVQRQAVLVEAGRTELQEARMRITALVAECDALTRRAGTGFDTSGPIGPGDLEDLLAEGRQSLAAVREAATRSHRRGELLVEDGHLVEEERLHQLTVEAERTRTHERDEARARVRRILHRADIDPGQDGDTAITAFRAGCAGRRAYEAALQGQAQLRRRVAAVGSDPSTLDRLTVTYAGQLRCRGGDPDVASVATPLGQGPLQLLEAEAERTRHAAVTAIREATAMRARIAGQLEGLPSLADLDDERTMCRASRDRARHQLHALHRARTVIEQATRGIHRAMAPRLAESVASRLELVTAGRYRNVNVDTEHLTVSLQSGERPELVPLELMSHGTRDQVTLLLRLALSEVFADSGESVPLLLDEPLLTSDLRRRQQAISFLAGLSRETQLVITCTDPHFAAQLCAVDSSATVVTLENAAPRIMPVVGRRHRARATRAG